MREFVLEPCNPRGKYLKIKFVKIEWDLERRTFAATIMFNRTRNRQDSRPLGMLLYADNQETMEKMLREMNLLYPVKTEMTVQIPEIGQEGEFWSC